MSLFDEYVNDLIGIEGGYSDHESDSGGRTRYGITEKLARRYGYTGDMRDLPVSLAKHIYFEEFWLGLSLDRIEMLSPSIVKELLDTGVNMGVGRAAEFLQVSLNAFNRQGVDYPDIAVDRDIGPQTLGALKQFLKFRGSEGELVLLRSLNSLQCAFYLQLAQARPKDEDFAFGWVLNRVVI